MLRHQGKFQCFVLILSLVGRLSVSDFWSLLCPFGCTYFFSFTECDCLVMLCHSKTNARLCFQKTSWIYSRSTICVRLLAGVSLFIWVYVMFFSLTACDCSVILSHNKIKNCRLCFPKKSCLTRDTEAPGPLDNTNFKLQLRIPTHYSRLRATVCKYRPKSTLWGTSSKFEFRSFLAHR